MWFRITMPGALFLVLFKRKFRFLPSCIHYCTDWIRYSPWKVNWIVLVYIILMRTFAHLSCNVTNTGEQNALKKQHDLYLGGIFSCITRSLVIYFLKCPWKTYFPNITNFLIVVIKFIPEMIQNIPKNGLWTRQMKEPGSQNDNHYITAHKSYFKNVIWNRPWILSFFYFWIWVYISVLINRETYTRRYINECKEKNIKSIW